MDRRTPRLGYLSGAMKGDPLRANTIDTLVENPAVPGLRRGETIGQRSRQLAWIGVPGNAASAPGLPLAPAILAQADEVVE
jgi:hypothetical protein